MLNCRKLTKRFGSALVLRGVDLSLAPSRAYALLGHSGSGKTTLARLLCGLESLDTGELSFSANARVMLLPQDFVIWPHLTVRENVCIGCRRKGAEKEWVGRWLRKLKLEDMANQRAGTLSFGQQQRVALARALCFEPDLLVLDEPLAHLDSPMRRNLAVEIRQLCTEAGIALLWITHEAEEAFAVADLIAVLHGGIIAQFAEPETVYQRPVSREVAELTGDISWLSSDDWDWLVQKLDSVVPLGPSAGKSIGLRPESVAIMEPVNGGCSFQKRTFAGSGYIYETRLPAGSVLKVFHRGSILLNRAYRLKLVSHPCIL